MKTNFKLLSLYAICMYLSPSSSELINYNISIESRAAGTFFYLFLSSTLFPACFGCCLIDIVYLFCLLIHSEEEENDDDG